MIKILDNLRILQSKKCMGLSLFKTGEDIYDIDFVELTKTKSSISITNKGNLTGNLSELIEIIPKGCPIIISLDGKGIIHKTSNNQHKSDNELLNSVFPNIKISEFYYQNHKLDDSNCYLSLVRQSIVDNLLRKISEKGIFSIALSLGPVSINQVLPVLGGINQLTIKNYSLNIESSKITAIQKTEENTNSIEQEYIVDSETITSSFILPFSLAFSYFINSHSEQGLQIESVKNANEEFNFHRLFQFTGIFILALLLTALLVNFLIFSHYNDKSNRLTMQYTLQKDNIAKLDTLAKKLEVKEKIIKEKKLFLRSKFSFCCDRIAQLLPNEVLLSEMDVQPVVSTIEENQLIEFEQAKIYIRGTAESSTVLGDWISNLKIENWADKVIMKDYTYDNKNKRANFNIEISLKND